MFDDGSTVANDNGIYQVVTTLTNNDDNLGVNEVQVRSTNARGDVLSESINVHFAVGPVVRFTSSQGTFDVEMFVDDAGDPTVTTANFLNYADTQFDNSIIHRSVTTAVAGVDVIQGGGFILNEDDVLEIQTDPPIVNEFGASNTRGTIAMARPGGSNLNTATSQWFINVNDNTALDNQSFAVFGRVIGGRHVHR